jgi:hypothetical protein
VEKCGSLLGGAALSGISAPRDFAGFIGFADEAEFDFFVDGWRPFGQSAQHTGFGANGWESVQIPV